MEESFLHTLLSNHVYPLYKKLVKKEENDADIKNLRTELENVLTEKQLELADKYNHACRMRDEYIDFQMQIEILNYGVKIGMQLQKAFDKDYYE